jgi:MFS family permease
MNADPSRTPLAEAELPPAAMPGGTPNAAVSLRDLSPEQWRSGIAAWLGWLFDGLDMHLYTAVATPFVALLLQVKQTDDAVGYYGSVINAAFLVGWALGGGLFGLVGDRLGRARALNLTILTYAAFTGLSCLAQSWWHLLACRFLSALGIGGEWAVGASLLSETWPKRWRPWIAAVLQTAVNIGVMLAMVAVLLLKQYPHRYVFLVGVLPALLVVWIRRAVPEPEVWQTARREARHAAPSIAALFRPPVLRTTGLTITVCALSLAAHWAFLYWYLQQIRNLGELADWSEPDKTALVSRVMLLVMVTSVMGNFLAALIARAIGYRRAISAMCLAYFLSMYGTYIVPRSHEELYWGLAAIGACQGVFGLFTMYLPPLFPTLLRTTGAGFCYNIGRIAAAAATVFFGLFSKAGDHRLVLYYAAYLFIPAAVAALFLSEPD